MFGVNNRDFRKKLSDGIHRDNSGEHLAKLFGRITREAPAGTPE